MQEPTTLKQIKSKIPKGKFRFRFRDVISSIDYMTIEDGYCGFIHSLNLDDGRFLNMNAQFPRYVLLSSHEEIDYLNQLLHDSAIKIVSLNYGIKPQS